MTNKITREVTVINKGRNHTPIAQKHNSARLPISHKTDPVKSKLGPGRREWTGWLEAIEVYLLMDFGDLYNSLKVI